MDVSQYLEIFLDETNEHLLRNGLNDLYDKRKNP